MSEVHQVICGDAAEVLRKLPDGMAQMCVTSPPYWGLRSYLADDHPDKAQELGGEASPEAWVEGMVEVFREVRRVLRDDGTLWVNVGDGYASNGGAGGALASTGLGSPKRAAQPRPEADNGTFRRWQRDWGGLKEKDLLMMPARLALALQADGWWLRSDIIWAKGLSYALSGSLKWHGGPMPESVDDRPSCTHEHLLLLSKAPRYYYDGEGEREESVRAGTIPKGGRAAANAADSRVSFYRPENGAKPVESTRSLRNVWALNPVPGNYLFCVACHTYLVGSERRKAGWGRKGTGATVLTCPDCGATDQWVDHFAAYPPALVEPCIRLGTSERGACPECGAPWRRVVEKVSHSNWQARKGWDEGRHRKDTSQGMPSVPPPTTSTLGWEPTCECGHAETVPQVVLDPFLGTGTSLMVARQLGRRGVGIELSPAYAALAQRRILDAERTSTLAGDGLTRVGRHEQATLFGDDA